MRQECRCMANSAAHGFLAIFWRGRTRCLVIARLHVDVERPEAHHVVQIIEQFAIARKASPGSIIPTSLLRGRGLTRPVCR